MDTDGEFLFLLNPRRTSAVSQQCPVPLLESTLPVIDQAAAVQAPGNDADADVAVMPHVPVAPRKTRRVTAGKHRNLYRQLRSVCNNQVTLFFIVVCWLVAYTFM